MSIISERYGRLVTSKEAADILTRRAQGLRTYTNIGVNKMVSQGRLTPVETIGRTNFFLPSDLESLKISPKTGNPTTRTQQGIAGTGVSRAEIAKRAGVSQGTVWNAFSKRPVSRATAHKLVQALNELRQERRLSPMTLDELEWSLC